jgi:hypothetical protein
MQMDNAGASGDAGDFPADAPVKRPERKALGDAY